MSIKKIAEITGTSPATVSRVLNNPSYKCAVPGLRDKIWRAAMDFFYPEYVIETYQTEKEGFQTMQKFLKLKEPPTGIYCANDITAIGMLKCLNRYSSILYRPSIISCDDIEEGQFIKPMLSTVQLPKENMARFALFVLLDRIRGGHKEVIRIELEGKLKQLLPRGRHQPAGVLYIIRPPFLLNPLPRHQTLRLRRKHMARDIKHLCRITQNAIRTAKHRVFCRATVCKCLR